MKKLAALILFLVLTLVIVPMGFAEKRPFEGQTVVFIASPQDNTNWFDGVFQDMLHEWEALSGATVDYQISSDDYSNDLVRIKLATGEAPEIWSGNVPQMNASYNAPVNCLPFEGRPWCSRLAVAEFWQDANDGALYCVPLTAVSGFVGVYYSVDTLKALGYENPQPKTYKEFLDMCQDIKDKGYTPIYMTDATSWCTQVYQTVALGYALKDQQDIIDKIFTNQLKFSDVPLFTQVMYDFLELYDRGFVNEDHMSRDYDEYYSLFKEKKAVMAINGEYLPNAIYGIDPEFEMGSFVIPFGDELTVSVGTFGVGLYVGKNAPNVDAALDLIDYLVSPENMQRFCDERATFSPYADVVPHSVLDCVANLYTYYAQGDYTTEFDAFFDDQRSILNTTYFSMVQELASGQLTPEAFWAEWDKEFSQFMIEGEFEGWV